MKVKLESIKNLHLKYKKFKICDANDPTTKIGILFLDISYHDNTDKDKKDQIKN